MTRRFLLSSVLVLVFLLLPGASALAASTWYVDGVHGSDANACTTPATACKTIGHAIALASSGDTIRVAAATYPENLTIPFSLAIEGAGAPTTIIDGGGLNTVVTIPNATSKVGLAGLTFRNGATSGNGGGISNAGTLAIARSTISGSSADRSEVTAGGGIYNTGTLAVVGSTLSGNTACSGGGIFNAGKLTIAGSTIIGNSANNSSCLGGSGGGVFNDRGTLTIASSTISANSSNGGGGITNDGTLTIARSTISANSAVSTNCCDGDGGGIFNGVSFTFTIASSTISENSATFGGGIDVVGLTGTLQDTIVADSPSGGNCSGTITSNGHNLSSDGTCSFAGPGDLNNTDPKLGPLQNNGGPTQTQALLAGSPAIDAGNPSGCKDASGKLLKTDQRGKPRPDPEDAGVGCDIGAFERQAD